MSTLLAFYQALSLSKKLGLATLVVGALILSTTATLRGIFLEQQHQQQNLQLLELISISLVAQIKDEINQGKQAELKTLLKSALN
nr:hypothetical protein [Cellvibrionaceae bacterium]